MQGWAERPYPEEKVHEILGYKFWVAARRLGILREEKVRQIDDPSEYFVNACTTVAENIPVAGVDRIANFTNFWADKFALAKRPTGICQLKQ